MLPSRKLTFKFLGAVVLYAAIFGLILPFLLSAVNDLLVMAGIMLFVGALGSLPFVIKDFIVKYLDDEQKALNNTTPKENN